MQSGSDFFETLTQNFILRSCMCNITKYSSINYILKMMARGAKQLQLKGKVKSSVNKSKTRHEAHFIKVSTKQGRRRRKRSILDFGAQRLITSHACRAARAAAPSN
jgi:hypothetical protein